MSIRMLVARELPSKQLRTILWVVGACILLVVCADLAVSGRKTYVALAAAMALLPIVAFFAVQRPLVVPFALWTLLVPFDNLLQVGKAGTVTRFVGIACVAAFAFFILRTRRIQSPPGTVLLWLGYAVWAGASILWAHDPASSANVFGRIGLAVTLYIAICATPADERDLHVVLAAVLIGGVASAIYGIHLFHNNGAAALAAQDQLGRLQIIVGDNGIDINHFADALLFPALAFTVGTLRRGPLLLRTLCGIGLVIVLVALKVSASREAYIALAAGLAYLFFTLPRYRVLLGTIGAVALAVTLSQPAVWHRFMVAGQTGGSGRTSIWRTALAAVPQHWLTGFGLGNFSAAYNTAYISVFQRYQAGWNRASHDVFLQALVELGVVGLIFLVAALIGQYRTLPRTAENTATNELYAVLHASFVALVVASVFIDLLDYKYFWLVLYVMAIVRNVTLRRGRELRSSG